MAGDAQTRRDNLDYRRSCQRWVNKSPLPAPIKATLNLILDHIGSPSDYTLSWVSHKTLAESQGLSERTIEWHCKAIRESGLLHSEQMGLREARRHLKIQFSYDLKGAFAHRLTFYRINRQHPFWTAENEATVAVLSQIKQALAGRDKNRTRTAPGTTSATASGTSQAPLNPVAGYALNPVAGYAPNPVAGYGQQQVQEEAADESPASSYTLESLEERTLPEERDSTSWKSRGLLPQLSGDDLTLPDLIRNETISQIIAEAECRLLSDNPNRFQPTSSDWARTSAQIEALFHQIRRNQGRYPTSEAVVDALNSESFRGLRRHSWGLLCARTPDSEGNYLCRVDLLEYEIIKQMSESDAPLGVNPVRRNHRLECLLELKRHNPDDPELDQLIREVQAESEAQNQNRGAES
jgi:hypothetical protein